MKQFHVTRDAVTAGRGQKSSQHEKGARRLVLPTLLMVFYFAVPTSTVHAAVACTGDVTPWYYHWDGTKPGYVGKTRDGTLTINAGSDLRSSYSYIGYDSGVMGMVTVDGVGSTWRGGSNMHVGYSGSGALNITGGGVVSCDFGYIGYFAGSMSTVTVQGADSKWNACDCLYVGYSGNGTLNIYDGYIPTDVGYIGYHSNATGVMKVDGSDKISFSKLYIGRCGNGTLNIVGDAYVLSASYSHIASGSGSIGVVTVDGSLSKWEAHRLNVGGSGNGTLNIINGATVISTGCDCNNFDLACLGFSAGSTGTVQVDGIGSTWNHSADLYVGHFGNGTLQISGGAAVTTTDTIYVGDGTGSTGVISFGVGGGTLTTASLAVSPGQLTGTGTINTRGLVSDVDLVFDSPASLKKTFTFDSQENQNVIVNLDMGSEPSSNGDLGVGWKGTASLTIRNGITVNSQSGYIGQGVGSTGIVTVDGAGSKWSTCSNDFGSGLAVGYYGNGTLNITGGGVVSSSNSGDIGSMGEVLVEGSGSTWKTCTLNVGGTLNVNSGGSISDAFGYVGRLSDSTGKVTIHGAGAMWKNSGNLYVGGAGCGTLHIAYAGKVSSNSGIIGSRSDSTGTVTVSGIDSNWTNGMLYIGSSGSGALHIAEGGTVTSTRCYIGQNTGGMGVVTIHGAGSAWRNDGCLDVGYSGTGILNIFDGGIVSTESAKIASLSLLTIDVGHDSRLTVNNGSGEFTNAGTVRMSAGTAVAAGTYSPISAGAWAGSGVYQAVGGIWDTDKHVLTVAAAEYINSDVPTVIDLLTEQRLFINDSETGWGVGVSFLASTTSAPLTFTATTLKDEPLSMLESLLGNGQSVLGSWEFTAVGCYTPCDPAYLSFCIPAGQTPANLQLWHFDGTSWEEYATTDLTCKGIYASFTVTSFSGYAITVVPEPGTSALVLSVVFCLFVCDWLRRN